MNNTSSSITDKEKIVRILSKEWLDGDKLLHVAFALRQNETYISVNRPSIDTFNNDVAIFVKSHTCFSFDERASSCRFASMNVGDVRKINVELDGKVAEVNVEVEPRNAKIKSHAGIFTRYNGCNLKAGRTINVSQENIPVDDILLKVRMKLAKISFVEEYEIK